MKDAVYEKGTNLTVEELCKIGEEKEVVYQIVTKYDTGNGYDVGIKTTQNLTKALEILKKDFLKESELWIKDTTLDEEAIKELNETSAYICLGDDYLSMYITANEIK